MKLLFLGTGSEKCKKKNEWEIPEGARRCSSMLIDGKIQLDVPIHTFDFLEKRGISPSSVTEIFLPHSHDDHFYKDTLLLYANAAEGRLIASHIGPHIHAVPAEETERILAEFGVIMAYDGVEMEI